VPDPITFGIECLAALWAKYRPTIPINSSNNNGTFGAFTRAFFLLVRKLLNDEDHVNEKLAPIASRLSEATVNTALRRFMEGKKSTNR
jgi:hypothetical protein